MKDATLRVEVTIVGAGLVGLSAALAFHLAGYGVLLVDAHAPTTAVDDPTGWDQRIYAISPKNAQWLMRLGAWQLMDATRISEMQKMEIWGDDSVTPLKLSAEDVDADGLGFIVEERTLKCALLQRLVECGIQTIFGQKCVAVSTFPALATLQLADGTSIDSDLLLAADGAQSWVRQQLHIAVEEQSYHQTAIVANFMTERSHQCIARQWFALDADGHVSIMAWLPLSRNKVSIVWSVSTQHAARLLKLDASAFTQAVVAAGGEALGALNLMNTPSGFPLVLKKVSQVVMDSVILIGDAAHRVHPMAGQGVNLGFRDVIELLNVLSTKGLYQALNDPSLLGHYMRVRKADVLGMTTLTNGLFYLFNSQSAWLKKIRNRGLWVTNHPFIRKMMVNSAISL